MCVFGMCVFCMHVCMMCVSVCVCVLVTLNHSRVVGYLVQTSLVAIAGSPMHDTMCLQQPQTLTHRRVPFLCVCVCV